MKKHFAILTAAALLLGLLSGCGGGARDEKPVIYLYPEDEVCYEKPAIYLYPEDCDAKPVLYLDAPTELEVTVRLDYAGKLTSTYPAYQDGWHVLARPDGTLTDPDTGREYYCLFWEGRSDTDYDFSTGFCVAGEDTAAFLEDALTKLGLNEREANEFIIYWLPRMEGNVYNLISFQGETYTDSAVLDIDPAPDSLLRVFMAWKELKAPVEVEPQQFAPFERVGFTAVEWGGCEVG